MHEKIIQLVTHPDKEILYLIIEGLEEVDAKYSIKGEFFKVKKIREIKDEIKEIVPKHKSRNKRKLS